MKTVEVKNETLSNLYIKVVVEMKTVEVKSRTTQFIPVDNSKDVDSVILKIKE